MPSHSRFRLHRAAVLLGLCSLAVLADPVLARSEEPSNRTAAIGVWERLPETYSESSGEALAIDGPNGILYRFGGIDFGVRNNKIYSFDISKPVLDWHEVATPSGGPSPRMEGWAYFDTRENRLVVVGGDDGSGRRTDVWAWRRSSNDWVELTSPTGLRPTALPKTGTIAYDSRRNRIIFLRTNGPLPVPVWTFGLDPDSLDWQLLPATESPDFQPELTADYDSTGDALWVRGAKEIWKLDLATRVWTLIRVQSEDLPGFILGCDPDSRQLYLGNSLGPYIGDPGGMALFYIELDPPHPQYVSSRAAGPRRMPGIYDRIGRRFVFSSLSPRPMVATHPIHAPYAFTVFESLHRPLAPSLAAGAIDPVGRALYVHGGTSSSGTDCSPATASCVSQRVHRMWIDEFPVRSEEVVPLGTGPGRLRDHAAVYDSIGHRILFYGGVDEAATVRSEVWELSLSEPAAWRQLPTAQVGPPRAGHGLCLDAARRFLYVVAGRGPSGNNGELWRLDLSSSVATWSQLPATLPLTEQATAGYDESSNRILVIEESGRGYEIHLGSGSPVVGVPADASLPGPGRRTATYDPKRHRMLLMNGATNCNCNHAWTGYYYTKAFGSPEAPGFIEAYASAPSAISGALTVFDTQRNRVLVLDGSTVVYLAPSGYGAFWPILELWSLQLDSTTPTILALVEVSAEDAGIRIRFSGEGATGEVAVERTEADHESWREVGVAHEFGAGLYEFLDEIATPGIGYRYRGRYYDETGEQRTAPSDVVRIPATARRLELAHRGGSVMRGRALEFEVRLSTDDAASLLVFDVRGRRVAGASWSDGSPADGSPRLITIQPEMPLGPGLYFAELRQGAESVRLRVIRL